MDFLSQKKKQQPKINIWQQHWLTCAILFSQRVDRNICSFKCRLSSMQASQFKWFLFNLSFHSLDLSTLSEGTIGWYWKFARLFLPWDKTGFYHRAKLSARERMATLLPLSPVSFCVFPCTRNVRVNDYWKISFCPLCLLTSLSEEIEMAKV